MFELVQTSSACPEQYDVYDDEGQVGYLRLRHGYFRAQAYSPSGPVVYSAETIGDGIFDPSERERHLSAAVAAISEYVGKPTYRIVRGD